jgi:hypothetical protein
MRLRTLRSLVVVLAVLVALTLQVEGRTIKSGQATQDWLGTPQPITPGVDFYTSRDQTITDPAGPTAMYLLKLDPAKVMLSSAHANDEIMGLETADVIAARHHAIAAVNAGFFNTRNGDPASVLKIAGELVSDSSLPRGVVVIGPTGALTFDQLSAKQALHFVAGGRARTVPIDGVDTTREIGKLMLYTPMYHADTDTAPTGTEIIASGAPLVVREMRSNAGHTPIPLDGVVLSYGGLELPPELAALKAGVKIDVTTNWRSVNNLPKHVFESAVDIVNGAGLLRRSGETITDWKAESLNPTNFLDVRHPRTVIGIDDRGFMWLVAVDGRQSGYASGMDFKELQRLCDRLKLRDALNLDGGGSVTMVVNDKIVNKPSDAAGPRPLSDVLLVKARK